MARVTTYEHWMAGEGIPVVSGYGVEDVREVVTGEWARTEGRGAFLNLIGTEGYTGLYVGEIPPGRQLRPQRHIYQELIYIVQGRGAAEVWTPRTSNRATFEWGPRSLFAIPQNCWYRLFSASRERVVYLGVTDAPLVMDLFHDDAFVFANEHAFANRIPPEDYFSGEGVRDEAAHVLVTNFIADIAALALDDRDWKGAANRGIEYNLADGSLNGHIAAWPAGRYHKAHHHQGGAILYIIASEGYSLMWPAEVGLHPYGGGREDAVVEVPWRPGAVFSPPSRWFHQHFNTGAESALQLAFRYTSQRHWTGFRRAGVGLVGDRSAVAVSHRLGGTLIEYEDEDPEIRSRWEDRLQARGIASRMPARLA